ncbi:MAG: response regulator transcription factor [Variovorax sp.]
MIRIGVADQLGIVRSGLRDLFARFVDLWVVGEAAGLEAAVELVGTVEIDVLILDLPGLGPNGADAIKAIHARSPRTRILVLSASYDDHGAANLVREGARGYLDKRCEPMEIVRAVRLVSLGQRPLPASVSRLLARALDSEETHAPHEELSKREAQVFLALATGDRSERIADRLSLSQKTVSTYRRRLMLKLGLASNSDLTRYALKHRLIH